MIYQRSFIILLLIAFGIAPQQAKAQTPSWTKSDLLFEDSGSHIWQQHWMLDGQRAKVVNTGKGMELIAGPEHGNDTCHAVLWTKQSFEGNICIEYDYTRTDTTTRCVNILYFHTTGKGDRDFPTDIALWNHKRVVPSMRTYFNNMNTYHISYAAFGANKFSGEKDYVRLRRYNPKQGGLKGTDIPDDHFITGLFKTNVTYRIQVFRYNEFIEMHIQNKSDINDAVVYRWDASRFPLCTSGRIGLRHMFTRSARYKDFRVWRLESAD